MSFPFRALGLYDWREDFVLAKHPEFLVELVENSEIAPTIGEFEVEGSRHRKKILKTVPLVDFVSKFPSYSRFELCRPLNGNFLDLESDLQYSAARTRDYIIGRRASEMTPHNLVRHISLFSKQMSPRYGFSHVMKGSADATAFLVGVGSTTMSYDDRRRAGDLGHMLSPNFSQEHLSGKLHDVYELNVLSPAHLERTTFGQTLASWIREKDRGELIEVSSEVAIWLVPDTIRSLIRSMFFHAGMLVVTV